MMKMHVFKNNSILRAVLICLLVALLTVSLCACRGDKLRSKEGFAEKSFRDKMADASVTEITVKDDLVLESPVEISGNKVLLGEGSIHAIAKDRAGEYMIVVPSGSSLTVKGSVTVDAHGVMGGVHVANGATWSLEENAVVTNSSAEAANALVEGMFQMKGGALSEALGHNILNKGDTTIAGGTVTGSGAKHTAITNEGTLTQNGGIVSGAYNNILVMAGGSFTWNGGSNQDSVRDGIFVAEGAKIAITSDSAMLTGSGARGLNLHGSAVIDGVTITGTSDTSVKVAKTGTLQLNNANISESGYHAIENAGSMTMADGQIFMNENCGIVNSGTLEVAGGTIMENQNKGILNKHNGKATLVSASVMLSGNRIAIGNQDTAYFEIANAKIMQSTTTNIYAYDGEVYMHDISLGASNSNNVRVVAADVRIEDTEIRGNAASGSSSMHALLMEGGKVDAKNVTISGATGSGLRNKGGNFKGENITIRDGKHYGISILPQDFTGRLGTTVITGLVMENIGSRNISGEGASTLIINDAELGATKLHNVKVAGGAEVILNDVDILGTTSSAQYGVLAEGGAIELNDVNITDSLGAAIRSNRDTSKVTGKNVKISNTQTGISAALGTVELDHLTTENIGFRNISLDGASNVRISAGDLCTTTGHNVKVSGEGVVTLRDTVVHGATEANQHGILAEGGAAELINVTIFDTTGSGIRTNRETSLITGSNIVIDNTVTAISASQGKIEISGVTTKNTSERNIAASNAAVVALRNADLCTTVNHNVKSESSACVSLKGSTIRGATGAISGAQYSILAEDGAVELHDVTIVNSPDAAIRINRDGSSVTGSNVKIDGAINAISANKGKIDINGFVTANIATRNINVEGKAEVAVTNGDLCMTYSHNVKAAEKGLLTLNNTVIRGTKDDAFGVAAETDGDVVLHNVSVMDADRYALFVNNKGSSITGVNVKVENTPTAICADFMRDAKEFPNDGFGTVNIDGFTTVNVADRNISAANGANITITNGDLCQTAIHSIKASETAEISLNKTVIRGVTGANQHGILAEGGDVNLNDVTIRNSTGSAIRVNRTSSKVSGINVSVENAGNALSLQNGEIFVDGLVTSGSVGRNISGTVAGKITVKNADLCKTTTHSIKVEADVQLHMSDATVRGVSGSSLYGILAEGGDIKLSSVTVEGCTAAALRVNRAVSEVTGNNVTIRDSVQAVSVSAGEVSLDDSLIIIARDKIGVHITADGAVTLNDSKVVGGKYAVINEAVFEMNGGEMFNSIWSLRNGETGTATLNGAYFYGNAEGTLPSDIHNAGKLIIDDITVGYNADGEGSSGVIYQTATAEPIVIKGKTLGDHTHSKPMILVAEEWERLWNTKQTITQCDDLDSAHALQVNIQPGKNEPKLYVSVRDDTLELTTQQGGNYIVKIGNVRFESFADAFDYMDSKNMTAATIQVVDSFDQFENVKIPDGWDITLIDDGDAHRVITNNTDGHMFTVSNNARLTVKSTNGSNPATGLEFNGAKKAEVAPLYVNGGNVMIEDDLTITNAAYGVWIAGGVFEVAEDATLNVTSSTYALHATGGEAEIDALNTSGNNYNMLVNGAQAEVIVNGGTFGKTASNSVISTLGTVILNDVVIEGTNTHSGNVHAIFANGGDVELTNVSISGADSAGIRLASADSVVTANNLTISDCVDYAVWSSAGQLDVSGELTITNAPVAMNFVNSELTSDSNAVIRVDGGIKALVADGTAEIDIAKFAASNYTDSALQIKGTADVQIDTVDLDANTNTNTDIIDINGAVTVEILGGEIGSGARNSVRVQGDANVTFDGVTFLKSASNNVDLRGGHTTLTDVEIQGNSAYHSVQMSGGDATMTNVTISGSADAGIRINHADSRLDASELTITGCKRGISMSTGEAFLSGTNAIGSAAAAITGEAIYMTGGVMSIDDESNINNAAGSGIYMEAGKLTSSAGAAVSVTGGKIGMHVSGDAKVELTDFTASGYTDSALQIVDTASVEIATVDLNESTNTSTDIIDINGAVTVQILGGEIGPAARNSVRVQGNANVTFEDVTFLKSASNNVDLRGGHTTLTDVQIQGNSSYHSVQMSGGDATMTDVTIYGATGGNENAGIRINNAESTLNATDITITGCKRGISMSAGEAFLSGTNAIGSATSAIEGDAVYMTGGALSIEGTLNVTNATGRGIYIESGAVSAKQDSKINLTNLGGSGIYTVNANATFTAEESGIKMTIDGATGASLISKNGSIKFAGEELILKGLKASTNDKSNIVVWNTNGSIDIANATLESTPEHNVRVDAGVVTLTDVEINGTAALDSISVKAGAELKVAGDLLVNNSAVNGIHIDGGTFTSSTGAAVTVTGGKIAMVASGNAQVDLADFTASGYTDSALQIIDTASVNIDAVDLNENTNANTDIIDINGAVTVQILGGEIGPAARNSVRVRGNANVTFEDVTFLKSASNNVDLRGGHTTLTDVEIQGNSAYHSVQMSGGDATMTNVTISGSADAGVRINHADSRLEASGLTITGCKRGISMNKGEAALSDTNTIGTAQSGMRGDAIYLELDGNQTGEIKVPKLEIAGTLNVTNAAGNGIYTACGAVTTATGSEVVIANVKNGINVGDAVLTANGAVTVKDATEDAMKVAHQNAEVTINEFNTENIGGRGAWIDKSKSVTINGGYLSGSGNAALLIKKGTLTLNGVTVENAKANCAVRIGDGGTTYTDPANEVKLIATGLTVKNCNVNALNLSHGTMTIDGLTVENIKGNAINMWAGANVTVKNAALGNTGTTDVVVVQDGALCIENVTVTNASGYHGIKSAKQINASGKLVADIYFSAAAKLNIASALTDGSDVTVDWAAGKRPADYVGIQFASQADMESSDDYIELGAVQSATCTLEYLYDSTNGARAELVPFVITNEADLNQALTVANLQNKTQLALEVGGNIDLTAPVDFGTVSNVILEDYAGDAISNPVIQFVGTSETANYTNIFGMDGKTLTLKNVTVDGGNKGNIQIPAGAVLNAENVTIQNTYGDGVVVDGTLNVTTSLTVSSVKTDSAKNHCILVRGSGDLNAETAKVSYNGCEYGLGVTGNADSSVTIGQIEAKPSFTQDALNITGSATVTINGGALSNESGKGHNILEIGGTPVVTLKDVTLTCYTSNNINIQSTSSNAKLTLDNVTIIGSGTQTDQHGIYMKGATVTVLNTLTIKNTSGGAIRQAGGIVDATASGAKIVIDGTGNSAIYSYAGTLKANDLDIKNNLTVTAKNTPKDDIIYIETNAVVELGNAKLGNTASGSIAEVNGNAKLIIKGAVTSDAANLKIGGTLTVESTGSLSKTDGTPVAITNEGTVNLAGKVIANVTGKAANVNGALINGSDVTVDWNAGSEPADLIAVTFTDAGIMSASMQYISLGATASADYLLYFDDAELVAKLVPFVVTTEEQLTDLIAAADYHELTTLNAKVGGDFAVANPVSIPAGIAVTITDDGDNTTGNTITYNGAAGSSVFDASACTEELTLSGISIDGTKKGTLLIPAGVTMNLNNVSISNAYKRGIDVYGTAKVTGTLNVNTIQSASGERFGIAVQDSGRFVAVDDPNAAVITGATVNISGADNAIEAGEGGYVEIKTLNISGCARSIVLADFDSAKTNDHNTKVTIHGGEFGVTTSNSVVVPVGLVDLRNVVIKGTASSTSNLHAIFANGGDVKLDHVDITAADCAAFRITSADSVIEAKDVAISGGEYVLWQDNGTLKLSGTVTVDGTSKHAFNVGTGKVEIAGTLNITNCVGNGFHIANGSVDVLDNANISMNVEGIGINVTGSNGGFTADGAGIVVNIQSKAEAIHTGAGTIVINGYKENGTNSVTLDGGTKNILSDGGSITVSNATLNYTTSHNVHSKGGMITLSDSNILDSGNYGVLAEGGNAELTNVVITKCNDGIRVNKAASSIVATNVTITNARRHGISVQNGQLTVNGATISGQVQRGILIQSGGTLNISGLIRAEIYAEAARKVNVTAALTDGSDVTVDWAAGKQPADLIAVTFTDAGVMSASKQYIALGATASADYLLYFDDAELVAKLVPFVVTTEEQLTDLIAAAEYYNMTTLTAKVGGDFTVANPVNIPAGMHLTLTDDGTARKITRASGFTAIMFKVESGEALTLRSTGTKDAPMLTIDGGSFDAKDVLIDGAGGTVDILAGVKIANNWNTSNTYGGAVRAGSGTVMSIDGAVFEGNKGPRGGAVRHNSTGALTVRNSTFTSNEATGGYGGAISVSAKATVLIEGCSFNSNTATGGEGGGALMFQTSPSVTVKDCTFVGNKATGKSGGAIKNNSSTTALSVIGCTFEQNSSAAGGAIYNQANPGMNVESCIFKNNSSTATGGAIHNTAYTGYVKDCEFENNSAKTNGGAIYHTSDTKMSITGCSFVKNSATNWGGAVASWGGVLSITDGCVFDQNSAGRSGGALFNYATNHAEMTVDGATFTRNSSTKNQDGDGGGAISGWGNTDTSKLTITNSIFGSATDAAMGNTAYYGGAIQIKENQSVTVENCQFYNNTTQNASGAIHTASNKVLTVKDLSFAGSSHYDLYVNSAASAKISGKMTASIYANKDAAITVDGTLTDGSDVTVDWTTVPATALKFTDAAATTANREFITLGATQTAAGNYLAYNTADFAAYVKAPVQAADSAALTSALANASANENTVIVLTGTETYQVSDLAVGAKEVTISSSNNAVVKTTLTAAGEMTGLTSGGKLTLDGVTLDGNSKVGYVTVPAGAVLNVNNVTFQNLGANSGRSIDVNGGQMNIDGNLAVSNVNYALAAQNGGQICAADGSKVTASNANHGVVAHGASQITLYDYVAKGCTTTAVYVRNTSTVKIHSIDIDGNNNSSNDLIDINGDVTVEILGGKTSGAKRNNIRVQGNADVTIENVTFGKSASNNVDLRGGHTTLTNVEIQGTSSYHCVQMSGGDATMTNVIIYGASGGTDNAGIRINNAESTLNAAGITITGCKRGISMSAGEAFLSGTNVIGSTTAAIEGDAVCMTGGALSIEGTLNVTNATGRGIYLESGTVTAAENAEITLSGIKGRGIYTVKDGVKFVSEGNGIKLSITSDVEAIYAELGSVSISGYKLNGENSIVLDGGNKNLASYGGSITVSNATLKSTTSHNIHAKGGPIVLSDSEVLGTATTYGVLAESSNVTVSNVTFDSCKHALRVNKPDIVLTATNVTITNSGEYGISVENGTMNLDGATITGINDHDIIIQTNGTLNISGLIKAKIYGSVARSLNVSGALADGSNVTVDWAAGLAPDPAITFASDDVMNASKPYITLGAVQATNKELYFADAKATLADKQ